MYLVDTNIFLEILLKQEKSEACKAFLNNNDDIHISDFTLHSIGVILFKHKEESIFSKFLTDTLDHISLISLPEDKYKEIIEVRKTFNLDFDDAYQYTVSRSFNLILVTMDHDFDRVKEIMIQSI